MRELTLPVILCVQGLNNNPKSLQKADLLRKNEKSSD